MEARKMRRPITKSGRSWTAVKSVTTHDWARVRGTLPLGGGLAVRASTMRGTNGQTGRGGSVPNDAADSGDEILVDRARTGDMVACDALMRRHKNRLFRAI